MGCCGGGGKKRTAIPRPTTCPDGKLPDATPDAFYQAALKGLNLCGRVGSGPNGKILASDVAGW